MGVTEILLKISGSGEGAVSAISRVEGSLSGLHKAASGLGNVFSFLGKGLSIFGATATGVSGLLVGMAISSKEVTDEFDSMAARMGFSASQMRAAMNQAVGGVIDDDAQMAAAMKTLALTSEGAIGALPMLFAAARQGARIMQTDVVTALDSIANSLATGNVRGLKAAGIVIDQTAANQAYAASLGIKVSEMNREQEIMSLLEAVQQKYGTALAESMNLSLTTGESISYLKARFGDLLEKLGGGLIPIVKQGTQFLSGLIEKLMQLPQPVVDSAVKFIALTGAVAAVLGPLLLLGPTILGVAAPILTVVGLLGGLYLAWQNNLGGIQTLVMGWVNYIRMNWAQLASDALNWGFSIVQQYGIGMLNAASSIIVAVLNSIGNLIASFLASFSPPKTGPLSTIDKWGQGLLETYMSGMTKADFGILADATGMIESVFNSLAGTGVVDKSSIVPWVETVRTEVASLLATFRETGQISEEVLAKIGSQMGDMGVRMADYLRLQLQYQQATQAVADAETALAAAKKKREAADKRISRLEGLGVSSQLVGLMRDRAQAEEDQAQSAVDAAKAEADAIKEKLDLQRAYFDALQKGHDLEAQQAATLQQLANVLGGLKGSLGGLGGISTITPPAFKALPELDFTKMGGGISDALTTGLNTGIDKIKATWDARVGEIKASLTAPFAEVGTAWDTLVAKFTGGGGLGKVATLFSPITNEVNLLALAFRAGGISTVLDILIFQFPVLGRVIGTVKDVFSAISDEILKLGLAYKNGGIENVLRLLSFQFPIIGQVIQVVSGFIAAFGAAIGPELAPAWAQLQGAFALVGPLIQTAIAAFQSLINYLLPIFAAIAVAALGLVAGGIAGLIRGVSGAVDNIISFFNGLLLTVTGIFNLFAGVLAWILGVVTGNSQMQQDAVQKMSDGVKQIWTGLKETVVNLVQGLWDLVSGIVEGMVDGIIGFFTTLYERLIGGSIIPDLVASILTAIEGLKTDFLARIGELIQGAIDAFAGAVAGFISAGESLIEGVKQGVINKAQDIANAAIAAIQNALDAIWRLLHPGSPSHVGMDMGMSLAEGIALGLRNGAPDVMQGGKDLGSSLIDQLKGMVSDDTLDLVATIEAILTSLTKSLSLMDRLASSGLKTIGGSTLQTLATNLYGLLDMLRGVAEALKSGMAGLDVEGDALVGYAQIQVLVETLTKILDAIGKLAALNVSKLAPLGPGVLSMISGMILGLVDAMRGIAVALKASITALGEGDLLAGYAALQVFNDTAGKVIDSALKAVELLRAAAEGQIKPLTPAQVQFIADAVISVIDALRGVAAALAQGVTALGAGDLAAGYSQIQNLADAAAKALDVVVKLSELDASDIKPIKPKTIGIIADTVYQVVLMFRTIADAVQSAIKELGAGELEAGFALLNNVLDVADKGFSVLDSVISVLTKELKPASIQKLVRVFDAVEKAVSLWLDRLQRMAETWKAKDPTGETMRWLTAFSTFLQAVFAPLSTIIDLLVKLGETDLRLPDITFANLSSDLTRTLTALEQVAASYQGDEGALILERINAISLVLKPIGDALTAILAPFRTLATLSYIPGVAVEALKANIRLIFDGLRDLYNYLDVTSKSEGGVGQIGMGRFAAQKAKLLAVAALLKPVVEAFSGALALLSDMAEKVKPGAKMPTGDDIQRVLDFVALVFQKLLSARGSLAGAVGKLAVLKDQIGAIQDVFEAAVGLLDRVAGANVPTDQRAIGAIISGLLSVAAEFNRLVGNIGVTITQFMPDADTQWYQIGVDLVSGLVRGLESQQGILDASLQRIADSLSKIGLPDMNQLYAGGKGGANVRNFNFSANYNQGGSNFRSDAAAVAMMLDFELGRR